ncbi:MAG TPA: methyl-accepting chemotaxis protein [Burkholderiaceae bacterium]
MSIALSLLLTGAAGLGGLWLLGRSLDTFEHDVRRGVQEERTAAALESHFKTQVQEWKNTLLRGSDAALLAKHWSAFQKEERAVSEGARLLLASQRDPALQTLLAQFLAAHQKMAAAYREGHEKFQASGFEASVGDMAVRGIDREPAKLLEELGRQMAERSAKVADAAYSEGRRATRWALMLMALGVALGLGIGLAVSRSVVMPLRRASAVAAKVARGDLSQDIAIVGRDEAAELMRALADMQGQLRSLVGQVRNNAESVATASEQIAHGNLDLSRRTEQQASALQQTAATMAQLGVTVRHSADQAQAASRLAQGASEAAATGDQMVHRVAGTMREINDSSRRIVDIIGVIDGIAYQTSILALNAAVEAARAGDRGRGFAIVANEVRQLAQRSAAAAKEINGLITASVGRVELGVALAVQTRDAMASIVASIKSVSDIVADISAAGAEQSSGVTQVGAAVSQIDQATQQNAALVEESAAASESLKQQARQLVDAVSVFRTDVPEPATSP